MWDRGGPASENVGKTSARIELLKVFLGVENTFVNCLRCIIQCGILNFTLFFAFFKKNFLRTYHTSQMSRSEMKMCIGVFQTTSIPSFLY